jgi:hypothetical protein
MRRSGFADGQIANAALNHRRSRETGSTFKILLNLAMDKVTPIAWGMAPPDKPVPAPRATTGTSSA